MDYYKLHFRMNSPEKPSKFLALLALLFAFILPFILVKTFQAPQKAKFTKRKVNLPTSQLLNIAQEKNLLEVSQPADSQEIKNIQTSKSMHLQSSSEKSVKQVNSNGVKILVTQPKDTLTSLFHRAGLSTRSLQNILKETPQAKLLTKITPNVQIQFKIKNGLLEKIEAPYGLTKTIVLYRDHQKYRIDVRSKKTTTYERFISATIHGSLYLTARKNNIPQKLIQQMSEILAPKINFKHEVHDNDHFTILYEAMYIQNKQVNLGDIVALSYIHGKQNFDIIRYKDRTGHSNYYTTDGKSLKKAFNRYPIQFSHIGSMFSLSRYHPVLHYARPHKGIDLAARIGTPIHAVGDGRIEIIGRQGGYGNMIKIKHNSKYSTVYGHMLKFEKGLSRGSYVHKDQIIGYVGQSGLATGPHCHFEFHINNQPRNPTTLILPQGNPLSGKELASLKFQAHQLLAKINLYNHTTTNRTLLAKK